MLFSKEFSDLQVDFALGVSDVTDQPITVTLEKYTGLRRNFNIPHSSSLEGKTAWEKYLLSISRAKDTFELKEATHQFYLARQEQIFPTGNRVNFGCFACEVESNGTFLRTHLRHKQDGNGFGPLHRINREKRLQELKSLFEFARANFPAVTTVGGFSWLYNIRAYANLFPAEYAQSGVPKEWYQSLAIWGQFLKSSGDIRPETTVPFLAAIAHANSWDELSECFKYKPLETHCPITRFYKFYGLGSS